MLEHAFTLLVARLLTITFKNRGDTSDATTARPSTTKGRPTAQKPLTFQQQASVENMGASTESPPRMIPHA